LYIVSRISYAVSRPIAGGVLALEHGRGVVEVAEQQRVGDEARLVAADHRRLPQRPGELGDVVEHVRLGHDGPDDLDEVLDRCGVEEVQADHPARVRGGGADLGHREGGRVRGEDGVRADDLVEPLEDRALDR
jgi:hypothetical protein